MVDQSSLQITLLIFVTFDLFVFLVVLNFSFICFSFLKLLPASLICFTEWQSAFIKQRNKTKKEITKKLSRQLRLVEELVLLSSRLIVFLFI